MSSRCCHLSYSHHCNLSHNRCRNHNQRKLHHSRNRLRHRNHHALTGNHPFDYPCDRRDDRLGIRRRKKRQLRIRMMAQLRNRNQRQELARSKEQEQARNRKVQEQLRNRNQRRRHKNGYRIATSACSTNQHASRKDRHRPEQLRNRNRLLELAHSKELEQVLVRSKELLPFRNRNRQQLRIRNHDFRNEHATWQANQRVLHKDQHRQEQHRNHNRLLELAHSMVLEQVLARSKEQVQAHSKVLLPFRNRNQQQLRNRNLNGYHNEHAAWQASQRASHKDQHRLAQLRIRNRLQELARSMVQEQVLVRSKVLLPFRNHNRQQLRIHNPNDFRNEHVAWRASQRVMHKDQHRLARLRNHNQPELAHNMELALARSTVLLVPGKSVHNRREFRDGYDYPSGSSGRSPICIRSRQRLRCIRNLLQ